MKKNTHVFVLILGMIIISLKSYPQDPNFHIYLCFGQSNMEGTGTIEAQDRITNVRVKVFQDQTCSNLNRTYATWYTAAPPLNRCWGGLGIADYFGKTMADATPSNITIGLIPASVGGCDIAFFQKGAPLGKASVNGGTAADIPPQFTGGYEWIIDMVTKAKRVGVIKGIIFHQGETNTGDPNWKYKVQGIVNNLRTDLSLGNVPFLAGELLYGQYGSCCSSHNVEVNKIPSVITNSYVISSSGLPGKDVAHFTSASYRTLGWRYAQQMLALVNNGCIPTTIESYVQTDGVNWVLQSTAQVCAGENIKLGPHPTTNSGWSWTGPGNFTAATREISLTNLTTAQGGVYTASYTNEAGCVSKSQITVTVNALPVLSNHIQLNGGTWDPLDAISVCAGSNIGSGPWPVSTTGWTWIGPNGFTGQTRELNFTNVETTQGGTYRSTYTDDNGCSASLSFLLTVNPKPNVPSVVTPINHCQNAPATALTATGTGLKWYSVSAGGTALVSASTPTTTNAGTTNYYVSQTTNGCESSRAQIAVIVNALPNVPSVVTPINHCQNASASALAATGNALKWYSVATGGTALVGAPTPITNSAGTTNYYVSQTSNGCESARAQIVVAVNTLPTATITTSGSTTFCQGSAVTLSASLGSSYVWKNGSTVVGSNQTYNATNSGNYSVEVSNGSNCKATSAITIVAVNAVTTWYADTDGDGAGDAAVTKSACSKPIGYVSAAGDGCPADANKIASGNCGCGNTESGCLDCAGVANGTASLDVCNICSGGTTGIIANTDLAACTTTGIVDLIMNDAIKILPNPSNSEFTLLLTNTSNVQVLSADGKLVEVFNEVDNLNFGGSYAKGVYILQISNGSTIQVLRVVKL